MKKLWFLSADKKPTSSGDIAKILQTSFFWVLWACLATHTKLDTMNLYKTFACINKVIMNIISHVFLETFGCFGHACLLLLKMIVSTCRKLQYLSAYQKQTFSFTSFLKCYILKNPGIWLASSILAQNTRTRTLPNMGLVMEYQLQYLLSF